jgi:hypothetical protein
LTLKGGPPLATGTQKGRSKLKTGVTLAAASWEDGSTRSNKRAPLPSSSEVEKKSKRQDDMDPRQDHDETNLSQSESRPTKLHSQTTGGFAINDVGGRHSLIKRNCKGMEFQELLLNYTVEDFMDGKDNVASFSSFASK